MNLNEFNAKYDNCILELRDNFAALLVDLFAADVQCVQWEQYTPYFNDGDECHFAVYTPSIYLKDGSEVNKYYTTLQYVELVNTLQNIFKTVVPEVFLSLFGDHVRVTITRDGAEIEEYDHE